MLTLKISENHQFLEEPNLPTPMTPRVYVDLLEGNLDNKTPKLETFYYGVLGVTIIVLYNPPNYSIIQT